MWFNASFFVYNLQAVLALVLAAAPAQLPAGLLAELTLEPLPHLGNDITTPYVAWDNVIIIRTTRPVFLLYAFEECQ